MRTRCEAHRAGGGGGYEARTRAKRCRVSVGHVSRVRHSSDTLGHVRTRGQRVSDFRHEVNEPDSSATRESGRGGGEEDPEENDPSQRGRWGIAFSVTLPDAHAHTHNHVFANETISSCLRFQSLQSVVVVGEKPWPIAICRRT